MGSRSSVTNGTNGYIEARRKVGTLVKAVQIQKDPNLGPCLPRRRSWGWGGRWGPSGDALPTPSSRPGLTLGLHAGPDQGQGVAGYLATGAGDGAAGQEHEDAWVGRVVAILLEPPVLQGLEGAKKGGECGLDRNCVTPRPWLRGPAGWPLHPLRAGTS